MIAACAGSGGEGVRAGMTIAHATTLLSSPPTVLDYEPAADEAGLVALARWAMRFTPRVAADPPDGLVLDVAGCERLYGGRTAIARQVRKAVRCLRLEARVAMAPTTGLAWGLARYGDEGVCENTADLLGLPISALRVDADVASALAEVGVDRISQLVEIPRRELGRRFGEEVLLRLDQANGDAAELLDWQRPRSVPRASYRFAGPATQYEAVEQTIRAVTGKLCEELALRELAARQVVLEVERLDADLRPAFGRVNIRLAAPSRQLTHLWNVLRPKVESLDMGRGVEVVSLEASQVYRQPHTQSRCDGQREAEQEEQDVSRVIDLLQSRLGRERVLRMEPTPSHVPEAAFRLRPAGEKPAKPCRPVIADGDRPTRLLDPAEPARVTFLQPEGPLATLHWRGKSQSILTTVGPERIGRRWWQASLSKRSLDVRDYYKLQCESGLWLWVYRTLDSGPANRWFVHGVWS